MNIKFSLDLDDDDILKEVQDEDGYYNHYELKDNEDIEYEILRELKKEIVSNISYGKVAEKTLKEFITNNKEEIINAIVNKVSKSIINNKAIKDLKKSLED